MHLQKSSGFSMLWNCTIGSLELMSLTSELAEGCPSKIPPGLEWESHTHPDHSRKGKTLSGYARLSPP